MINLLMRPFSYLAIKSSAKDKRVVDWLIPFVLASGLSLLFFLSGGKQGQFVGGTVLGLLQILPGFYIAALAAVVVFNRHDIDRHMPQPTPTIKDNDGDIVSLTRRRFLSMIFSFLTAQSILLIVYIGIGSPASILAMKHLSFEWYSFLKNFYFFTVYFIFFQVICITFLCLYYLGERLHQPDP